MFIYYGYSVLPAFQKRSEDLIIDGYETPYVCWELNSRSWGSPSALQPELSLQPQVLSVRAPGSAYFTGINC